MYTCIVFAGLDICLVYVLKCTYVCTHERTCIGVHVHAYALCAQVRTYVLCILCAMSYHRIVFGDHTPFILVMVAAGLHNIL